MSAHTPGPWVFEGTRLMAPNAQSEWGEVCVVDVQGAMSGNTAADARLIAAAPDLLEACIQAAVQFRFYEQQHLAKGTPDGDAKAHRNHEMAKLCEAAIAKATGAA